ncbi:UDP-N-acetylmuramate--L-alanine ligase [Candidatus Parcubacteria bacterium]|nr:MAG: UDP-N-acetylmuramate--L-alanine ligase [Candidatus Parcubacteria bacterium]
MRYIDLSKIKKAHFIGIGGIGVSAIARMMLEEGKRVSGSDQASSLVTDELGKLGVKISIGHDAKNIPDGCDAVIHTAALAEDNPELVEARRRNVSTFSYSEALGLISKEKYTIAVSGTHGKTTTTAMLAKILINAEKDPTVIVGSLLKDNDPPALGAAARRGSNFIHGKSKYLVVEADEYKKNFHSLNPKILVVTNIDEDHLDFYKDLSDIQNAFAELASKIPEDGFLITDKSNPNITPILETVKCEIIDYARIAVPKLKLPGDHNRMNAKAALGAAAAVGVDDPAARKALEDFEGPWRRFEYKGITNTGALVYDDYAHNPQKVEAVLAGAREYFPGKRIIAVFQPHLYSRTKHFLGQFSKNFKNADMVVLAPIYAAREKPDPSISSDILRDEIAKNGKTVFSFKNFSEIEDYLRENAREGDVVMTIGAGDIYKVGEELLKKFKI